MTLFAIIPAYNEEKKIREVIQKTKNYAPNVVVVDDGSHDQTSRLAEKEGVKVLRNVINVGKGAALRTGCDYALQQGATHLVVLDADGQHDPKLIPLFTEHLQKADIVFGYRQLSSSMPFILRFGNWFISNTARSLFKVHLHDTQSGYRAFTAEAYTKIRWQASDYSMESEMIAKVGKHKLKYAQVPIQTIYTDRYKGTTIMDGIKIVFKMLRWRV